MEEDGGNGLHFSGIIVAVLLIGAWAFQQEQLTGARPEILPAQLHPNTLYQDIPARLWEDPFDAVARYRNRRDSPYAKQDSELSGEQKKKKHEVKKLREQPDAQQPRHVHARRLNVS